MEGHISDTRTVCWEICHIHPQSDHTLFLDILWQVLAGCKVTAKIYCSRNSRQTFIDILWQNYWQ